MGLSVEIVLVLALLVCCAPCEANAGRRRALPVSVLLSCLEQASAEISARASAMNLATVVAIPMLALPGTLATDLLATSGRRSSILVVFSVVVTAVPSQPAGPQTPRRAIRQFRPAAVAAVSAAAAVVSAAIAADIPMKLPVGVLRV